jgi:hypothetical protein
VNRPESPVLGPELNEVGKTSPIAERCLRWWWSLVWRISIHLGVSSELDLEDVNLFRRRMRLPVQGTFTFTPSFYPRVMMRKTKHRYLCLTFPVVVYCMIYCNVQSNFINLLIQSLTQMVHKHLCACLLIQVNYFFHDILV